ncbi:probable serine/threonine-protein kinase DDB_G0271682 [Dendronephthya gigantea]|uniref:probable serine/threonine-protein kinase DDB_G0271682 n=1 Tax=Dendronephthya gigantea TaxID=151771 RepID=UPI00106D7963|nr:probable serine/threonine-protein kinase DDB_G0271682 [Dendronephthya gigantea]
MSSPENRPKGIPSSRISGLINRFNDVPTGSDGKPTKDLEKKKPKPKPKPPIRAIENGKLLNETFVTYPETEIRILRCFVGDLLRQLQQERSEMATPIQQRKQEKTEMANEIEKLQHEKSEMANQIQQLDKEKADMAIEIEQLREERSEMATQSQQLSQEKTQKKNKFEQLQQENKGMGAQIQQLSEEKTEMANEIEKLRKEDAFKEKQIRQNKEEIDGMRFRIQKIQDESKKLKEENDTMKIEIQQLQHSKTSSFVTESGTVIVSTGVELGRGAYGAVYKGNYHGTEVAVKEFYEILISPHNMKLLEREINIAALCRHPNLLQFLCATKTGNNRLLIVTELMDTSLRSLLEEQTRKKSRFNYQQIKLISLDVARGLNYLHSKEPSPIIHRDVSSANVLLMIENHAVRKAKISDYGSANFMEACNTKCPGAAAYSPPDVEQGQHSPKIDVFSYGLLVSEMYTRELPSPREINKKLRRIKDADIRDLVKQCTSLDPKQRPTMQQVIEYLQQ